MSPVSPAARAPQQEPGDVWEGTRAGPTSAGLGQTGPLPLVGVVGVTHPDAWVRAGVREGPRCHRCPHRPRGWQRPGPAALSQGSPALLGGTLGTRWGHRVSLGKTLGTQRGHWGHVGDTGHHWGRHWGHGGDIGDTLGTPGVIGEDTGDTGGHLGLGGHQGHTGDTRLHWGHQGTFRAGGDTGDTGRYSELG